MTTIEEARAYVGTTPLSGFAQLALAHQAGMMSAGTDILEIGCGSLHFAKALLAVHRHGFTYGGIDPNYWLRDVAVDADPVLGCMVRDYDVEFSAAVDFDGRAAFGRSFDFVFSHSVLSHVGHAGLREFMAGARNSLRDHGTLLVSVNVAKPDTRPTMGSDWTYPAGVTVWADELRTALLDHRFAFEVRPDLRTLYMSFCPVETHDWIVATKQPDQ